MPNSTDQNTDIETDLAQLSQSSIQQLRQRWQALFRTEPPAAFGPDLLRRSIAQRIQEQHYGGLSASVRRELNQIVKAMTGKSNGRIELPRQIKPGAVFVRTWKDKSHRVMVLDDGFAFEGRTYTSLSEIAREITGTRWNGPKFFGLRVKAPTMATTSASSGGTPSPKIHDVPKRRGRLPKARTDLLSGMEIGHDR